ncbi:hypothetical protein GMO_03160 [Gluconobacter morbifer G707]|uniref:Uncharacterized protein n=1 Tax=Gluconobacter morbifer G707 TaxID=1088869 RepID=G6XFQ1_9PROT|nr:DUF488 family protein [Gluconobacter morbifer]EHH69009.1 hypothetical protein GMO_03160 [Gluconobacter morbifer G707]
MPIPAHSRNFPSVTGELRHNPDGVQKILARLRQEDVTLLYASHDLQHNRARVLKDFLEAVITEQNREP